MTSPLTTGGIRGNKRHAGTFHPRSFNMGIARKVYEETGGYRLALMGEEIELSIRIIEASFSTALIEDAFVYHKRRTNLVQFFKQLHFFGRARINISRFYPDEIKLVHLLPALFSIGLLFFITLPLLYIRLFNLLLFSFFFFFVLLFLFSFFFYILLIFFFLSFFTSFLFLNYFFIFFFYFSFL